TALGRRGDGVGEEGDVPTAARLRAVYLNSGQNARRGAAEALPLSPRARFAAATPASVPAGWLRGGALAIGRLDELSAAFLGARPGGAGGVVAVVWEQLVPPAVAAHRPISAPGLPTLLAWPHRFMLERTLYLTQPVERPPTDVIAPVAYGSLFHAVAERFFR